MGLNNHQMEEVLYSHVISVQMISFVLRGLKVQFVGHKYADRDQ